MKEINFDDLSVKYDYPAYVDLEITSSDRNLIFSSNKGLGFYSIFTNKTKKTFLSDNAFKHGAASIIYQISVLKRYVDTFSAIHINKSKNFGETLFLINPFKKKIVSKIISNENKRINLIIPPESVRELNLNNFMTDNFEWKGHIQIYATNRLVTFISKHAYDNSEMISDFEHLDPYRTENTTLSLAQMARVKLGNLLGLN